MEKQNINTPLNLVWHKPEVTKLIINIDTKLFLGSDVDGFGGEVIDG